MRILLTFLFAVAWFAVWAEPASAGPLGPAIGAIVGAFKTVIAAKTIGAAILKFALSTAVSLLMRRMSRKKASDPGISTERKLTGGVNSRSIILGKYATAGVELAPPMSQGNIGKTPNVYLTYVVAVSSLPIYGVHSVIINGEYVPIGTVADPDYGLPFQGKFSSSDGTLGWLRWHDGKQTAADAMLVNKFSGYQYRPWSSSMVGTGIAYMVPTFRYHSEYLRSEPELKYVILGALLYDPRKDSSRGGSGPQRWGQPNTYEFTENPVVMIYNIMLGIDLLDGRTYGVLADLEDLPLINWVAAMNKCDETVTTTEGDEPRYRAGCEVKVAEDEPGEIVDMLLDACCGSLAEIGGVWKIRVGEPDLPVMFITDKDFLITKPQELDPFPSIRDSRNTINANYPSPEELWSAHDAPSISDPTYVAEDGDEIFPHDINLNAVSYKFQVQRVMWALLKDDRRWRAHTGTFGPYGLPLEPLDVVAWTSARNGYVDKLFEITATEEDLQRLQVGLSLREVDPTDYNWNSGMEVPDPVAPGGWILPNAQGVPGFSVMAHSIEDSAGGRRPVIRCSWDPEGADDARALKISVRKLGETELTTDKTVVLIRQGYTNVEGVMPSTSYEVQARYVADRPTVSTSWLGVTTGSMVITENDLSEQIWDDMEEIAAEAGIPSGPDLPPSGSRPNQLFLLVPPGTLYRWDADAEEWTTSIYAGIPPDSITMTELAQSIQPPVIWTGPSLPVAKQESEVLLWNGKLYRWNGAAYTSAVPAIDIDGQLIADQIAASAITPEKLAVIPGHNLVTDPKMMIQSEWFQQVSVEAWTFSPGKWTVNLPAITGITNLRNRVGGVPIASGLRYRSSFTVTNVTASESRVSAGFFWYDANGTYLSVSWGGWVIVAGTTPTIISGESAAPANARFAAAAVRFSNTGAANDGTTEVSLPELIHINTAATIADNAIETAKIVNGAIESAKLADAAATEAKIAAGAITEVKIASGAVTGTKLADLAVSTSKIANAAIETAKLADGAATAAKIAAGAITTVKIDDAAITAAKVAAGAITEVKIDDAAITAAKVAAGAITEVKIATGAVSRGKIVDDAINSAKLADGAATEAKIAAGAITEGKIADLAVSGGKIVDSAITALKLANNAVTTAKIAAGAVVTAKLADGAATAVKIATGAITEIKIADGAVTNAKIVGLEASKVTGQLTNEQIAEVDAAKIAGQLTDDQIAGIDSGKLLGQIVGTQISDGAVSTPKLAANAVTANKIDAGAVSADKIAANAVTAVKIAAGAVETAKLAAGAVIADKIASNAITAIKISAGAVETAKLAAGAVEADKIAAGAVTTGKLAANAVEADKIAANAITTAKLAAGAVEAGNIAAGAVTTAKLAAGAVEAGNIAAGAVIAGKIAAQAVGAAEIAAGAVLASKIAVGDFTNLITDPDFTERPGYWTAANSTLNVGAANANYPGGRNLLTITATGSWGQAVGNFFGVEAGREYFVSWRGRPVNTPARARAQIFYNLRDGSNLAGPLVGFNDTTSVTLQTASFTPPDDAVAARIHLQAVGMEGAQGYFGTPVVRLKNNGELIVDGAITAAKIAAGAVEAGKIAAGAVTAGTIAAGAVQAGNIAAGAVEAGTIAAGSVTTDKIATGAVTTDRLDALAVTADKVAANAITAAKLAANSVQAGKIVSGAVTTDKLAANAVEADKIAANAVTTVKLAAGAVDAGKIAAGAVITAKLDALAVTAEKIAVNAVTAEKILAGSIETSKIAAGAVETSNLAALAVTAGKIAVGAITAGKIAADAVTAVNIEAGAIVAGKLAANAVEADNIAANAVTSAKILAGAIQTGHIAAGAVQAGNIAAGAIEAGKIASGAVTTDKLDALAVTAPKIAAGAIETDKLAANAVTAGKILAGAVTAVKIATDAITSDKILANAITTAKIATGAVTANELSANSVTSNKIAANAITAGKVAAGAIGADQIAANSIAARHLLVADWANLVPDSDFVDPLSWDRSQAPEWQFEIAGPLFSGINWAIAPATQRGSVWSKDFSVEQGKEYYFSIEARQNQAGADGVLGSRINWLDGAGASLDFTANIIGAITGNRQKFSGSFVAPSDAKRARIHFYCSSGTTGQVIVGAPTVRLKNNGELIVDGAITANKIAANAVTADSIAASAIIASKIATGAVTAGKISVANLAAISANLGAITAGSLNINNNFIVTSTGQTTIRSGTSGERLVITNNRIDVYDASGTLRVRMGQL